MLEILKELADGVVARKKRYAAMSPRERFWHDCRENAPVFFTMLAILVVIGLAFYGLYSLVP